MARFGQESREVLDTRIVIINFVGWRPGLVVKGRDSGSEGCGFKSWHHILDGHFFTYICCKNCNVCLKRPKINKKEAGIGPFFNNKLWGFYIYTYTVWTNWAIYWTWGNFSKPLATILLPKSPTFLGNFCKGVKILNFSREIVFGQLLKTFGNFLLVTLPLRQMTSQNYRLGALL